jgi:ribosomal protein S12 methylthiotransferase accessory factor
MRQDKPYKAVNPVITINNIRNILAECGIFLIEENNSSVSNFFSTRLIISNNELFRLEIGQNGKGLTPEYSLASAYGEFMERLQNYNIFVNALSYAKKENIDNNNEFSKMLLDDDLVLDFSFDPDEKSLSYEELTQKQKDIFNNIAIHNELVAFSIKPNDNKKMLCAPFYCVNERCSEFLPISLIYVQAKSNGMCAGNTKEEAILQGICEIFERYVAKIIYKYELTPPTIPTTLFKGTKIYELISQLEEDNNISIIVKDCSLNKGLPVIGLLIVDHDSNSSAFHLGADTSPVIALERCFTELFQCRQLEQSLEKIDVAKDPFRDFSLSRMERINEEFFKFIADGSGKLPNSILSSNFSYSFNGLNQDLNKSDKEDLIYLLDKIEELGFNTYIRDVSFLNFPSFFVYIPGMSEITSVFESDSEYDKIRYSYSVLYNIKNNSIEEYIQAVEILEKESKQIFKLFPYNIHEDNIVNKYFLLTLIHYRLCNFLKAYENLSIMIDSLNDEEFKQNIYLLCSRDYIYYRSKGLNNDDIAACLQCIYKSELLSEVINDLENEANIFQYQNFPTCFNCMDCKIKNGCFYLKVLRIMKNVQEKHKTNRMNQDNLKWISELS